MTLTAHLTNYRAARDHAGGYLVKWADGSTFTPDWTSARAEAAQVAKVHQCDIVRVGRDGEPCGVVCTVPGAGSGDVVVVQFGGAADRKVAA